MRRILFLAVILAPALGLAMDDLTSGVVQELYDVDDAWHLLLLNCVLAAPATTPRRLRPRARVSRWRRSASSAARRM